MQRKSSRLFAGLANVLVAIGGAIGIRAMFSSLTGKRQPRPAATAANGEHTLAPRGPTEPSMGVAMQQAQGQAAVYTGKPTTTGSERPDGGETHPLPPLKPGWSRPKPEHIPRPTYAPSVMALGIVFILWGIVATYLISAVGLVLFFIALAGWIGELRHGD